eukprot:comp20954_c1_seq1/m.28023 comp20954_c1_seq1/g.28023  ORF comp20954_c1_seq1/g.28023 comp20954_c1_seq1/m.28023 type:complete len:164 (-) comp20954_c1_seq1:14-505(-)
MSSIQFHAVPVELPADSNVIVGTSHFIKTVEDLHEVMVNSNPNAKFGLAFCEASGPRLIRKSGNDENLTAVAVRNAQAIGAGHSFVLLMQDTFPVNVLNAVKQCREVCTVHCATANPLQVIVAETSAGRGIMGVIDGQTPLGVEGKEDEKQRHDFLRMIGYKL